MEDLYLNKLPSQIKMMSPDHPQPIDDREEDEEDRG